jgi:hypothetical protein
MFAPPLLCEDRVLAFFVGFGKDGIKDFEFVAIRLGKEGVNLYSQSDG